MKIDKPACPTCGALARGTIEVLSGCAEFEFQGDPLDGVADYSGTTSVFWDGQMTEVDPKTKQPTLLCPKGHEWSSAIEEGPDDTGARP